MATIQQNSCQNKISTFHSLSLCFFRLEIHFRSIYKVLSPTRCTILKVRESPKDLEISLSQTKLEPPDHVLSGTF